MQTSKEAEGCGIVTPSKGAHSIRQVGRGANSIPRTLTEGFCCVILLAIAPSPHPISNTDAPEGTRAARKSERTRTRRPNTARPCARFSSAKAKDPCGSFSMQYFYIKPRRNAAFSSAGFSLCAFFCVLLKLKPNPNPNPNQTG